jgi:hypothetical protein
MHIDEIIAMAREANFGFMITKPKSETHMQCNIDALKLFAVLVEQRKCYELAKQIEAMPFGDTAASFAVWIREQA